MLDRSKFLTCAAVALLATLPAANALRSALDADTGWHLRIGRFIADTGTVPRTDPISRPGTELRTPWIAYSWLYEWPLAKLFDRFDAPGVLWFRSALVGISTGIAIAFAWKRLGTTVVGFAVALGLVVSLMPMATERPWHATIAFTALCLGGVQSLRAGGPLRSSLWLIPLFALWANLHIQFVYGLLILGLACIDPGRSKRSDAFKLAVSCFGATLLNPYHFGLYGVILDYGTDSAPGRIIQELAPPDPFAPWSLATLLLVGWAAVQLLLRRPFELFEVALFIAGAALASRMNRDLWFGALTAVAILRPDSNVESSPSPWKVVALSLGVALALRLVVPSDSRAAHERVYPVRAVAAIRESRPAGPLFNDITWGGYLAWNLPEYPVTIDGRTNLHGGARLTQSFRTWETSDGWTTDPEFAKCNLVLARRGRPLTEALREREMEWRILHEDDLAVVFARTEK